MSKKGKELLRKLEAEVKAEMMSENIDDLQKEIISLRKTLEKYGIKEELHVTNIEYICQKGISDLSKLAQSGGLTQDDAKTLDILHKNLRMVRGNLDKKEVPGRAATEAELLKIVKNDDK